MTRAVNDVGLALIKWFEGLRLTAYQDDNGIWTIGYGHTGQDVTAGRVWTPAQADIALLQDLRQAATVIDMNVTSTLTDNQYAALCSFVFNVGPGNPAKGESGFVRLANGKPSTLLRLCNIPDFRLAALEFPKWDRDSRGPSAGLLARRKAEQSLFRS